MCVCVCLSVSSFVDSGSVSLFMCIAMEMLLSVCLVGVVVCCWLLTVRMFYWLYITGII